MKQRTYNKLLSVIFFIIAVALMYLMYLFISLYISHADFNNIGEVAFNTLMVILLIVWIGIPVCLSGYLAYLYFIDK
jgi:bacteriorhodopsin